MAEGKNYNFYKGSQNVDHIDKQINKYYYGKDDSSDFLTPQALRKKINVVLPFFKCSRHWFCICKVLMEVGELGEGDFESGVIMIKQAFPNDLQFPPDASDLSELYTDSFKGKVEEWDPEDSPIKKGFGTYKTIGLKFLKTFEEE